MAHITNAARQAFASIFARAVAENFSCAGWHAETVALAAPTQPLNRRSDAILLTTSSFRFRLTAFFRVVDARTAQECYESDYLERGIVRNGEFSLPSHIAEAANMACGAMNRELLNHFAHLALSAPSLLHSTAERLFQDLHVEHVVHFGVLAGGTTVMDASLAMLAHAPVDFRFIPATTQAETGELELW